LFQNLSSGGFASLRFLPEPLLAPFVAVLVLTTLLLSILALLIYVFMLLTRNMLPEGLLAVVILLIFAGLMCIAGLWEAGRMSDKKIDATRAGIQKQIDEIKRRLNPPA
jgi:hypothetical protein